MTVGPDIPLPLAGRCVLVVEDEPVNQQVVRSILQQGGARTIIASDGEAAIRALERQPTLFHAVLMDIQLPGMDGYETTRTLRERLGLTVPVLALSAHTDPESHDKAKQAGMDGCLSKPVSPDALITRIAALFGQAPELAGLDLRTAMIRLGGNRSLWLSLLHEFEQSQATAVTEARQLADTGKTDEATRSLHRLRGVAANLGATDVARLAAEAETALKDGKTAHLKDLFSNLQTAMVSVFAAIHRLPAQEAAPAPTVPPGNLMQELGQLQQRLGAQDLGALACFDTLRPALPKSDADRLAEALARLDFAYANQIVLNIMATIKRG